MSESAEDEMLVFAGLPDQHGCVNGVGDQARFDYPLRCGLCGSQGLCC